MEFLVTADDVDVNGEAYSSVCYNFLKFDKDDDTKNITVSMVNVQDVLFIKS